MRKHSLKCSWTNFKRDCYFFGARPLNEVICLREVPFFCIVKSHVAEGARVTRIDLELFVSKADRLIVGRVGLVFVASPAVCIRKISDESFVVRAHVDGFLEHLNGFGITLQIEKGCSKVGVGSGVGLYLQSLLE